VSWKRNDPHNQRDRKRKDRFVALSHDVIDSPAFQYLSPRAVKLLILIRRRYNGFNNGKIAVAQREAAHLLRISTSLIGAIFIELQAHGFIQLVRKGDTGGGNRLASEWALTDRPLDITPSNGFEHQVSGWRNWRPDSHVSASETRNASRVSASETWRRFHVSASETENGQIGQSHVSASETHISTMDIPAEGGGTAEAFASAGRDRRRAGESPAGNNPSSSDVPPNSAPTCNTNSDFQPQGDRAIAKQEGSAKTLLKPSD
jgi:hypothetical protein